VKWPYKNFIAGLSVLAIICICAPAMWLGRCYAGNKRIELTDGTVIYGDLISVKKECWTISSDTLGIVKLDPAKIKQITSEDDTKETEPQGTSVSVRNGVGRITDEIQADSEMMRVIRSLRDDPQVRQVLEDPALMKAIQSNDISYLMSNPKFLALMQNPKIRQICQKVMENNQGN